MWWFDFINLDDNLYVYDNPFVRPGLYLVSVKWALTTFHAANWHPLTWVSHMLDAELFGPFAGGHHITNVVLHSVNAVLAYFVFNRLTGRVWESAIVAALFAVHPAHVESVAWVAERKDLLSTLFGLLTIMAYVAWVRRHDTYGGGWRKFATVSYLLVLLTLALGLMSKPMLVTLPFVLVLLDYWPLNRLDTYKDLGWRMLEKLPLFVLSAVSAYMTLLAQKASGAVVSLSTIPYSTRIANALVAYVKYVFMLVYPADLAVGYAYPTSFEMWRIAGAEFFLAGITALCLWQRHGRPYLIVGWLWFLGTLVPVIGFVQVGAQPLADRYTYIPYFGLFLMIVWGAAEFVARLKLSAKMIATSVAIAILLLSVVAFKQASYWSDSYRLYNRSIEAGNANFLVYYNLCSLLIAEERFAEAEVQCQKAIEAEPRMIDSYTLLGMIYARTERTAEASSAFKRVAAEHPYDPIAYTNLAVPLMLQDQLDDAEASLDRASVLFAQRGIKAAHLAASYGNLADALTKKKDYSRASKVLQKAISLEPSQPENYVRLASVFYEQGELDEAKKAVDQAVGLNGELPESQNVLGMILLKQGDRDGAVRAFENAVRLKPDYEEAKKNLEGARKGG